MVVFWIVMVFVVFIMIVFIFIESYFMGFGICVVGIYGIYCLFNLFIDNLIYYFNRGFELS